LLVNGIVECNGPVSQFPANRAFWIILCQISQLLRYLLWNVVLSAHCIHTCVLVIFCGVYWDKFIPFSHNIWNNTKLIGILLYLTQCRYTRGAQIFQKFRNYHKTLSIKRVTCSRFCSEDPQILGTTIQKVIWLSWHPGVVHLITWSLMAQLSQLKSFFHGCTISV